jgi:hypothetical protein
MIKLKLSINRQHLWMIISIFLYCFLFTYTVNAQETDCEKTFTSTEGKEFCENVTRTLSQDSIVPASPAISALGVSSETVINPKSPDEFALGLINGFDPNGNFQNGLAMDFNPALLFFGNDITIDGYRENTTTRLLTNTQFSIATTKSDSTEDKSSQLAVGLHLTPWIQDDPRLNRAHLNCIGTALVPKELDSVERKTNIELTEKRKNAKRSLDAAIVSGNAEQVRQQNIAFQAAIDTIAKFNIEIKARRDHPKKVLETCRNDFKENHPNAGGWSIGITPTWLSKEGDLDNLDYTGSTIWTSIATRLGPGKDSLGKITLHAKYRADELAPVAGGNNTFFERDTLTLAGNFSFDGKKNILNDHLQDSKFTFEGAYFDADAEGTTNDDKYYQLSANAQFHVPNIGNNIWLDISFGKTYGREGDDESFGKASFNWAFNDKNEKPK